MGAGWDGIEEQGQPARSGSPPPAGPSSWRGNGWLPLQSELARGPALVGRARELELLAAEADQAGGPRLRTVVNGGAARIGQPPPLDASARAVPHQGAAAARYRRWHDRPAWPTHPCA